VLPLKYLDKIYRELNISCEITYIEETVNQHIAKKYGMAKNPMKLIVLYEHFMTNDIIDKSIVNFQFSISRISNYVLL
jgi:hypothetical protein